MRTRTIAFVIALGLIVSAFLINRARPKVETEQPDADPDPTVPFCELNVPKPGHLQASRAPVIFEVLFRLQQV